MRHWRGVLAALVVWAAIAGSASAALIADYQTDWLPGGVNGQTRPAVSADGWDYM